MGVAECGRSAILLTLALGLLLSGCAKNFRTIPDLTDRARQIKIIALARPDVKIYEVSAGGLHDLRDEWSEKGRENVAKALLAHFSGSSVEIRLLEPDGDTEQELKEVQALFEAVSTSIILHTYSAQNDANIFPHKVKNFDYSVGSLETLLRKSGADALLLLSGVDEVATGGKKALNVLGAVTGVAVGALTGVAIMPRMEGTVLRVALADRNGAILWYSIYRAGSDLQDPNSSSDFVNDALTDFPGLGR